MMDCNVHEPLHISATYQFSKPIVTLSTTLILNHGWTLQNVCMCCCLLLYQFQYLIFLVDVLVLLLLIGVRDLRREF